MTDEERRPFAEYVLSKAHLAENVVAEVSRTVPKLEDARLLEAYRDAMVATARFVIEAQHVRRELGP